MGYATWPPWRAIWSRSSNARADHPRWFWSGTAGVPAWSGWPRRVVPTWSPGWSCWTLYRTGGSWMSGGCFGRAALPEQVRADLVSEVCRGSHHVAGRREFVGMATGSRAALAALLRPSARRLPVLVVSGHRPGRPGPLRTRLWAAHARLAAAYGGEHVFLDGAGHLLPREHPVAVAELVARFCRAIPDGSSRQRTRPIRAAIRG